MAPAEYPSPSRVKTFEGFLHKWLSFLSLSLLLSKIGEPVLQGPHETSPPHFIFISGPAIKLSLHCINKDVLSPPLFFYSSEECVCLCVGV